MNHAVVPSGSMASALQAARLDLSIAGDSTHLRFPVKPVSVVEISTAPSNGRVAANSTVAICFAKETLI